MFRRSDETRLKHMKKKHGKDGEKEVGDALRKTSGVMFFLELGLPFKAAGWLATHLPVWLLPKPTFDEDERK